MYETEADKASQALLDSIVNNADKLEATLRRRIEHHESEISRLSRQIVSLREVTQRKRLPRQNVKIPPRPLEELGQEVRSVLGDDELRSRQIAERLIARGGRWRGQPVEKVQKHLMKRLAEFARKGRFIFRVKPGLYRRLRSDEAGVTT